MKEAIAGSFESCDCLVMVKDYAGQKIEIESIVYEQFGEQIHQVIQQVLEELGINNIYIKCHDKGAYDYTIRARIITAIKRLRDES